MFVEDVARSRPAHRVDRRQPDEVLQQPMGGEHRTVRGRVRKVCCTGGVHCFMMTEFAIRTEELSRTYRRKRRRGWFRRKADDAPPEFTALDRVTLDVRPG